MNKPLYEFGNKVEFTYKGIEEPLVGLIEIVDGTGTFFQRDEPSYDIYVGADRNCLYKHVPESDIRRKVVKESITRGILKYNEKADMYSVLYSRDGYEVVLDNPSFTEIRLTGMDKWVLVSFVITEIPKKQREDWMNIPVASLKEWVGKSVEIRYMPPFLQVCELIQTHQDDRNMIYEVYREDTNVVLFDGGFVMWKPEDLVLRGGKHHVAVQYGKERVYRWDVSDGVMRLCLGPVSDPDPDMLESAREWMKLLEIKARKIPDVPAKKKLVVERLRMEEYPKMGLKRMVAHANHVCRVHDAELLTPVTQYGFEYRKDNEWHKVYYQTGWIMDALVSEEGEKS